MKRKIQKNLTLSQWLIQKINTKAYRAGTLSGMMHPKVDQSLIDAVGGLPVLTVQAKELEKDRIFQGMFRVDWCSMGRDLKQFHFSVDMMDGLCRREGMENPRERQLFCMEQVKALKNAADTDWINPFYDHILERLEAGELVKDINLNSNEDLDDRAYFLCLNGVVRNRKPVWERVFSEVIFRELPPVLGKDGSPIRPSKCFEQLYRKRMFSVLKEYSPLYKEGMEQGELLNVHGICSYAQTLEWKGPLSYRIDDGAVIDTSGLVYGTVLNTQTLEHARPWKLSGVRRIVTIENKANYESMPYAADTLYIFCHGFFSPKERRFLSLLAEKAGEDVEYLHWGDMDYGGICIFQFIQEELFPGLKPWRMGRAEYERAVKLGAGVPLESEKRESFGRLQVEALQELKDCILERNMEIEQEILLADVYRNDAGLMHSGDMMVENW